MNPKFENIIKDEGTWILSSIETKLEFLDSVHEVWIYEGIKGYSRKENSNIFL